MSHACGVVVPAPQCHTRHDPNRSVLQCGAGPNSRPTLALGRQLQSSGVCLSVCLSRSVLCQNGASVCELVWPMVTIKH